MIGGEQSTANLELIVVATLSRISAMFLRSSGSMASSEALT
jgi:hypothetical protein